MPGRQREQKIELRTFDADRIARVGELGVGETVTVTAGVESNKLTNKARQEVQVDGRAVWCMVLTIRTLAVEGEQSGTSGESEKPKPLSLDEQSKKDGVDW